MFDEKSRRIPHSSKRQKEATNKLPRASSTNCRYAGFSGLLYQRDSQSSERSQQRRRKRMKLGINEYSKAQRENILKSLERFGFHDCVVTELQLAKDVVMCLDTHGGFTNFNMITFDTSEIIKQEGTLWEVLSFMRSYIVQKRCKPCAFWARELKILLFIAMI